MKPEFLAGFEPASSSYRGWVVCQPNHRLTPYGDNNIDTYIIELLYSSQTRLCRRHNSHNQYFFGIFTVCKKN